MRNSNLICVALLACSILTSLVGAQENDFPVIKGPYLGQKQPGDSPILFAPGIISTDEDEYAFEISCSGDEMLFVRNNHIMLVSRNVDGIWKSHMLRHSRENSSMMNPFSLRTVKKSTLCQDVLPRIRNIHQTYGLHKKRMTNG